MRAPNGHVIVLGVHLHDARILARGEAVGVAALRVADDVAEVVVRGPLPIGPGDLLAGDEHAHVPLLGGHLAFGLASLMDHLIDLQARAIVGRHDQRAVGLPEILARDRIQSAVPVWFVSAYRCRCNVLDAIPASSSCCAARDVGAKPST